MDNTTNDDTAWAGPFFVKKNDQYELAPMCKSCAFGDKDICCLNPCTYLWYMTEKEDNR